MASPSQLPSLISNPVGHSHVKLPRVLTHSKFTSQSLGPLVHSSMSARVNKNHCKWSCCLRPFHCQHNIEGLTFTVAFINFKTSWTVTRKASRSVDTFKVHITVVKTTCSAFINIYIETSTSKFNAPSYL